MARFYRYRLPPWCQKWLIIIERCLIPIIVVQVIRTLLFPTTLDVFLTGLFIGIYVAFYLKWI
ncbi:hypothetical protein [Amphibacillus sediminis]|uniref:hypothetical protein n=1 Tax=Amphibacillus sediminis TaxID=360185 RepID=UPI00082C5F40|nr:hypothetical protein [Amphibacillus sediminis]